MKRLEFLLIIVLFISITNTFSQVGIGTTSPDDSSILDVVATDKGLLIPRVSLDNVLTTMLDGVNTAATGLLIYNTNVSVIGGNGAGYYYFNGTIWEQLKTSSSISDHDFYEEGTTTSPNSINDDIYTQGNVAIGKTTADYALDIEETVADIAINLSINSTSSASEVSAQRITNSSLNSNSAFGTIYRLDGNGTNHKVGIRTDVINSINGNSTGLFNHVSNNSSGSKFGVSNLIGGSGNSLQVGFHSRLNGINDGAKYGVFTEIPILGDGNLTGSYVVMTGFGNGNHYGSDSYLSVDGTGFHYGSRNRLYGVGIGNKYGSYNYIDTTAGGNHYGVYSIALRNSGTTFAGYFLGNVAVGTNSGNTYILPSSRGSINQVMQTDATGNVSWVDPSTLASDDHDFYEEGTTNSPNSINDDMYTLGNVAIGKTTADYALDIEEFTADRGVNVRVNQNDSSNSGIYIINSSTGNGLHHGVYNDMTIGNGLKFGVRNEMLSNSVQVQGVLNNMIGNGSGSYIGTNNFINATGTGTKYGSYTRNSAIAQGDLYGVYSDVRRNTGIAFAGFFAGNVAIGTQANTSVTPNYYILPSSRGTNNQIMQTDATGNVNWVDNSTVGTDNQNISGSGLSGTNLTIGIENGTSEIVDLSSLQDGIGTDDQTLSYNATTGQLDIEDGNSVNLAIGDITTVTAGDGLTGGGTTGALALDVVAVNGLTANANDIVFGGALTQATTITQGTNNLTFNLNSSGDFIVQDNGSNHFEVQDSGNIYIGGDTNWYDINTSGTAIAALTDDGDDGRFRIFENGITSVDLDANTWFVFNEQGLDRDFRIESDDQTSMFRVDAGNNRIGIMKTSPSFDVHIKQSGITASSAGGIALENSSTTANWKIYHSGDDLSFAESGTKRGHIASGSGMYVPVSDRRLKKSITDVESILGKISNLKLYRYLYKDQELSAKKTIGFMAQDIQPLFPELVSQGDDGYLGLNYSGFGVLAIKSIQEQQDIIDTQEQQIEALKRSQEETQALLNMLLERIEKLEAQD
nr:tail fiber domain-containing protein [uncultured Psychroserpens sp.]